MDNTQLMTIIHDEAHREKERERWEQRVRGEKEYIKDPDYSLGSIINLIYMSSDPLTEKNRSDIDRMTRDNDRHKANMHIHLKRYEEYLELLNYYD